MPEIGARRAAGSGSWDGEELEAGETRLLAESLIRYELRASPDELQVIVLDGDSVEPILSSGDRIPIDMSRRHPAPPGIFVIWDGLGLVAKRIEHVRHLEPQRVMIKSVNPR